MLGTFYEVVSSFLHGFSSFLHEGVVGYGIGGIGGEVLYLISGG